jgi:hypothetical protein
MSLGPVAKVFDAVLFRMITCSIEGIESSVWSTIPLRSKDFPRLTPLSDVIITLEVEKFILYDSALGS